MKCLEQCWREAPADRVRDSKDKKIAQEQRNFVSLVAWSDDLVFILLIETRQELAVRVDGHGFPSNCGCEKISLGYKLRIMYLHGVPHGLCCTVHCSLRVLFQ